MARLHIALWLALLVLACTVARVAPAEQGQERQPPGAQPPAAETADGIALACIVATGEEGEWPGEQRWRPAGQRSRRAHAP